MPEKVFSSVMKNQPIHRQCGLVTNQISRTFVYGYIAQEKRRKLYPHARKGIFVGYGESVGVEAYKLFDLKTRKFRSVNFDEEGLLPNLSTKVEHSHQNINTNQCL